VSHHSEADASIPRFLATIDPPRPGDGSKAVVTNNGCDTVMFYDERSMLLVPSSDESGSSGNIRLGMLREKTHRTSFGDIRKDCEMFDLFHDEKRYWICVTEERSKWFFDARRLVGVLAALRDIEVKDASIGISVPLLRIRFSNGWDYYQWGAESIWPSVGQHIISGKRTMRDETGVCND